MAVSVLAPHYQGIVSMQLAPAGWVFVGFYDPELPRGPAFMRRPHRKHPIKTFVRPEMPVGVGKRMASENEFLVKFDLHGARLRMGSLMCNLPTW
ncbi:hypothetical protein [Streptomyces triculaminicus]|uniref:hypothetical protein n=1 Tax=Streptomyces triculaminicus TaxID=2816232 RepID=UPI00379426BB